MIHSGSPGASDVLVDSSVWIDFYRPSSEEDVRSAVSGALARDVVHTVALIVTEVVRGAPDEPALEVLLEDFSALRTIELGFEVGAMAARIGYALRRHGRSVPATDLLIGAAAIEAGCEVWHRDAHFEAIAEVAPLNTRSF